MAGEAPRKALIQVDGKKAGIAMKALKAAYDESLNQGCGPWDVLYAHLISYFVNVETAYQKGIPKEAIETFATFMLDLYLKKYSKNPQLWKNIKPQP